VAVKFSQLTGVLNSVHGGVSIRLTLVLSHHKPSQRERRALIQLTGHESIRSQGAHNPLAAFDLHTRTHYRIRAGKGCISTRSGVKA